MVNKKNADIDAIRHSLSHLLAAAVLEKYPKTKLGIGPTIEHGFYYDFLFQKPISDADLEWLERRMREYISAELPFTGKPATPATAKKVFAKEPFKLELIEDLKKAKQKLTIYKTGDIFTDLCRGGHVKNTKEIPAEGFKLWKLAGAYWKGDEKNKMLTRIYGLAFRTKGELDEHLKMLEEAAKRDHRKLGKDLDLFVFSPVVGKGLPLWTEKGTTIRRELERFIVDEEIKRGYRHVSTPELASLELYKKSGHYPYYKESMYAPIKIEDEEYMLRPMACPHHFELYLSRPRSYRELPLRIAELAKLFRFEKSGELTGLMRVRSFCLADSHIICADPVQAESEVNGVLDLIEHITGVLGLSMHKDYWYRLSLGDRKETKKYYKDDKAWDRAERALRSVLKKRGCKFTEAPGEAAFYGPKIDIQMRNVFGKEDTAFTVQYDFVMSKRFKLNYIDQNGKEKEAIVIHRSSIGAIERIVAFLIEYYAGAFPLWLSPVQARILPIGEHHAEYARKIFDEFRSAGIRIELDESGETLGKRIREAELQKIPYVFVVGEKEKESESVSVRSYKRGQEGSFLIPELKEKLQKEISEKTV